MTFNSDSIKNYAVAAVTDFVTNGTSLSQGIAKIASAESLNPEMIKRCVEASNTIAHLKLLSGSSDRTFEFPVAKYEDVLGHMVTPDAGQSNLSDESPVSFDSSVEKSASTMSRSELETYVHRSVISTKAHLEKLACDKQMKMFEIEDSIKRLQKQESHLEKFAEVCEENEFGMVFGMEKSAGLNTKLVFEDKELTEARKLVGLIKEAKEIIKEEHEKQAFLGAAAGLLGKAVGSTVGLVAKPLAKGISSGARNLGNIAISKIKGVAPSSSATTMSSNAKKWGNRAVNLGLGAAFTEHASGGSVWNHLQG